MSMIINVLNKEWALLFDTGTLITELSVFIKQENFKKEGIYREFFTE